jgi:hypothetical protein
MHRIVGDPVHPPAHPRPFAPGLLEQKTQTLAAALTVCRFAEVAPTCPTTSNECHPEALPSPHVGVLIHRISFWIHRMVLRRHSQSGVSCDPVKKELAFHKPLNACG